MSWPRLVPPGELGLGYISYHAGLCQGTQGLFLDNVLSVLKLKKNRVKETKIKKFSWSQRMIRLSKFSWPVSNSFCFHLKPFSFIHCLVYLLTFYIPSPTFCFRVRIFSKNLFV